MEQNYLIPANSKKGLLIMNLFYLKDIILFGSGVVVTVILIMIFSTPNLWQLALILSPALITGFLVLPIPNYHNALTLITSAINFYSRREKFKWKGWCFYEKIAGKK